MKARIVVGEGSCGLAAGAGAVYAALETALTPEVPAALGITGCIGICYLEPIVDVYDAEGALHRCVRVKPEDAETIVSAARENDYSKLASLLISPEDETFLSRQTRIALRHCGLIDPENINEYIGRKGYLALHKVLTEMTPEQVIQEILDSGLRGRGGGGFPTGMKWKLARNIVPDADQKYVCCNADEGDPGAFMDRSVLEGDPHVVLEAMTIAGFAIGATQGYIYVRAEYPIAVQRLRIAIKQAREIGMLGKDIFGTGFDFDIDLRLGAGAFV